MLGNEATREALRRHVEAQHRAVHEAAARGDDLPDSFPLSPDVFTYVYPESRTPAPVRAFLAALRPHLAPQLGVGVYEGALAGAPCVVVVFDTDGDHGWLCVLSPDGAPALTAYRLVERLDFLPFDEWRALLRTGAPRD